MAAALAHFFTRVHFKTKKCVLDQYLKYQLGGLSVSQSDAWQTAFGHRGLEQRDNPDLRGKPKRAIPEKRLTQQLIEHRNQEIVFRYQLGRTHDDSTD
jgi:hypothetical protein